MSHSADPFECQLLHYFLQLEMCSSDLPLASVLQPCSSEDTVRTLGCLTYLDSYSPSDKVKYNNSSFQLSPWVLKSIWERTGWLLSSPWVANHSGNSITAARNASPPNQVTTRRKCSQRTNWLKKKKNTSRPLFYSPVNSVRFWVWMFSHCMCL